jgi:hypothetical protein
MNWLYNMVTQHGEFQEYSDFARAYVHSWRCAALPSTPQLTVTSPIVLFGCSWIQARQATADMTQRHDRRRSSWWELAPSAQAPADEKKELLFPMTQAAAPGPAPGEDVGIRDVITNALACEEFRKFCAPHQHFVDFLQSVDVCVLRCAALCCAVLPPSRSRSLSLCFYSCSFLFLTALSSPLSTHSTSKRSGPIRPLQTPPIS